MNLKKLGNKTYIIDDYNRIGIYLINEKEVAIIDTGLDEENGKKIMNICKDQNWDIKMILNTHSHPDHIGGNSIIQKTLNVNIYASKLERVLIENPILISSIAYGGYPHKYLQNKYILPVESKVLELTNDVLPEGLEYFSLPGHNSDMVGFKTSDNIYFLADAIAGENVIKKYHLQFMYDVEKYFETLNFINNLDGKLFVPSHGDIFTDNKYIVELNKAAANNIINTIKEITKKEISFEYILKRIFDKYNLNMEFIQYSFISSTIKCYLSYMMNNEMLKVKFKDNELFYSSCLLNKK